MGVPPVSSMGVPPMNLRSRAGCPSHDALTGTLRTWRYDMSGQLDRRDFLKKSLAGTAAGAVTLSLEEQILLAQLQKKPASHVAGILPANRGQDSLDTSGTAGSLPTGQLGKLKVTRLIVGGNLTSGNAHSRDLIYVSGLLRQYFTDEKIFETWTL
ncbi:MAG: twin-arginine translocation signal domain-containing protein, partial [Planctomycetes bacterium]|nr:twin-arginine translocation signal domain-containing protein [Planctomycetota bacterium]